MLNSVEAVRVAFVLLTTYLLHSTILLTVAWGAVGLFRLRNMAVVEVAWKAAALLGLITAPMAILTGWAPAVLEMYGEHAAVSIEKAVPPLPEPVFEVVEVIEAKQTSLLPSDHRHAQPFNRVEAVSVHDSPVAPVPREEAELNANKAATPIQDLPRQVQSAGASRDTLPAHSTTPPRMTWLVALAGCLATIATMRLLTQSIALHWRLRRT